MYGERETVRVRGREYAAGGPGKQAGLPRCAATGVAILILSRQDSSFPLVQASLGESSWNPLEQG